MTQVKAGSQIARRYAEAFFSVIPSESQANILDEFEQALTILEDQEIKRVFAHPRTGTNHKRDLIKLMKLSSDLEQFILLCIEKKRDPILHQIASEFKQLVLRAQNTVVAKVISTVSLSHETLNTLSAKLAALSGKDIIIENVIDPLIGGGLIIKLDGKVIDGSIAHKLAQLKRSLTV